MSFKPKSFVDFLAKSSSWLAFAGALAAQVATNVPTLTWPGILIAIAGTLGLAHGVTTVASDKGQE